MTVSGVASWSVVGIASLVWLYVAARMITRAVIRSIREKEEDLGSQEKARLP